MQSLYCASLFPLQTLTLFEILNRDFGFQIDSRLINGT